MDGETSCGETSLSLEDAIKRYGPPTSQDGECLYWDVHPEIWDGEIKYNEKENEWGVSFDHGGCL